MILKSLLTFLILTACFSTSQAQHGEYLKDESGVPTYTLPNFFEGKIQMASDKKKLAVWEKQRREEVLNIFREEVYGHVPPFAYAIDYKLLEPYTPALGGKALRKQIEIRIYNNGDTLAVPLLIYTPVGVEKAPLFFAYNYYGNHTVVGDGDILLGDYYVRSNSTFMASGNRPLNQTRGVHSSRWPVYMLIENGFAVATSPNVTVEPDNDKNNDNYGIRHFVRQQINRSEKPNEWGAISAWAWYISRVVDYLEKDTRIDKDNIFVLGHSRLGKTALWAAAQDQRIAMAFSNESGSTGAALSRRKFGETVKVVNTSFPYWMNENYKQYNDREENLPIDQHMLLGLIAPRPLYVASASKDLWADPRGELLAAHYASEIYALYGLQGLYATELPRANQAIGDGHIGYHIRSGTHDLTYYDWSEYIKFAKSHL